MPRGVLGLLTAGVMASSMSSVDSGIHSCCTVAANEFGARSGKSTARPLLVERRICVLTGIAVTVMALFVGRLGSLFEIANRIVNGLGAPLLAIVLLGIFNRTVSARGMFLGGIMGFAWSVVISVSVEHLALHYYAAVNLFGSAVFCQLFSMVDRRTETGAATACS